MKFFTGRRLIAVLGVIVVVGVGAWFLVNQDTEDERRVATVERGLIVQDVTFTGRLRSVEEARLGFAVSGPITSLSVEEGSVVGAGQVLAQIDGRVASLDSSKALADKASAQAETLVSWDKAKIDEENTKLENTQKIEAQKQVVRDKKAELDQALSAWQTRADDEGDDSYLAKTAYSTYLAALSAYNSAQEALTTLRKTVEASNDAAKQTTRLAREKHVSTVQASGGVAGLSSLGALERRAGVLLSQHALVAPFAGTVTGVELEVGEFATAGVSVIRLETIDQLEISSDVTETDAFKIKNGMTGSVTFDALPPNEEWEATVTYVAPSAEIVEGVPVYEVRLAINMTDITLKPGMTANVDVHTDSRDGVLIIPRRAVHTREGGQFVIVVGADGFEAERPVETGLIGSDGTIEITSGLEEGENVLISRQSATP